MKVKNIVFSGFAAAILAAGAANAAATDVPQIASKAYVDRVQTSVDNLQQTIETNYTTTEDLPAVIAEELNIDDKADKIKNVGNKAGNIATVDKDGQYQVSDDKPDDFVKKSGFAGAIAGALSDKEGATVQEAVSDAVNGAIDASMQSEADGSLGAELAKKEDAVNKVTDIEANKNSDITFPTTKAVADYTAVAIASAVDSGIDVNSDMIADDAITSDKIKDGAVTESKLADDAVTSGKIKDGAVTEDKLADGVKTKLDGIDGKADKIEVTSGQAGNIATVDDKGQYQVSTVKLDTLVTTDYVESVVEKYTVSVPKPNCDAESGLCLLSTDTNGNLTWVNVTEPAE